ncbi:extracellular solute-binding protein [Bradyrhizobium sp. CSS354]|uniref:extracellular solute-binding protein n=1 Tax=Bradyrhizobium sp. CSS354 TaxID=2699172 RepID=UPI0023BE7284|nr:extracellular solute-binding protein [Bradyrhizobium sp. CSS354]
MARWRRTRCHFTGFNYLQFLVDNKLLIPLDAIGVATDWNKLGYSQTARALGQIDGKTYAIPFAVSVPVVYFNMKLVRESGWSQPLPESWDGLIALAKRINAPDRNIHGIFYQWDGGGGVWWQVLVSSFGGHMLTPAGKVAFDDAEGQRALDALRRLVEEGGMPYITYSQASQMFSAGTLGVAMMSSSWMGSYAKSVGSEFPIEVRSFPIAKAGGRVPVTGNAIAILSKDTQRQQAAWEYLKFLTSVEAQTKMAQDLGSLSMNELAVQPGSSLQQFYATHPAFGAAAKSLDHVEIGVNFPGANGVRIASTIKDDLEEVVARRNTVQATLAKMTADVAALLPPR